MLLMLGLAGEAGANVLPDTSRALPIKAPSLGGMSVGTATLTVTYSDSEAKAVATASTLSLGKGNVFRVQMCVKAHAPFAAHETQCETTTVDTRSLLSTIVVGAPSVTARLARPSTGRGAYFSYVLSIRYRQADGSFKEVASSWPAAGLGAAYVGVPVRGQTTAAVPASVGVPLKSGKTGGVNSGLPDSMCTGWSGDDPAPPGEGVSTELLGADAPAYYEVGEPSGDYAGKEPRGVILIIHGGGWTFTGPPGVATMRADADRWRARGWRTLNITYRPCATSFTDVRWFYDRALEVWGDSLPYCAAGASAGGTLALMLAHARSSVDCAVDMGGPTDGLALRWQRTSVGGTDGPRWIYNGLAAAVAPENVHWWSPARFPIAGRGMHARVLFALAADDPYIPLAQGVGLRDKMQGADPGAYVDLVTLPRGDRSWVHAMVSQAALDDFHQREERLVAPLVD
jgi:acetyl esterase/lipase